MSGNIGLSRRELLELGLATGLVAGLSGPRTYAKAPPSRRSKGQPRNVIFMVSDGMSMGVPSMAEPFSQLARQQTTQWYELLQSPSSVHGLFETGSLNSLVTDSAAASTAWASGSRVFNGSLNVLPDGTEMTPIGKLVPATGRRVGLVTTTQMTHATPAGFASIQASRDAHHQIAPQYLGTVDVLMGGGIGYFDVDKRGDGRDLIAEYTDAGYSFWDRRRQVQSAQQPDKVLGLFWEDHLPYTIDHRNQDHIWKKVPTLAEMTQKALEILARDERGFLLQVEGGRVDHAAHANDAAALLWDQLAFDDAVAVARRFASQHPDTLVVITSDHGNANPGLNGSGSRYRETNTCFERLVRAKASYEGIGDQLKHGANGNPPDAEALTALVQRAFGLTLQKDEVQTLRSALNGDLPLELSSQHRNLVGLLGQMLGNYTSVGWTGVSHTQDLVLITSFGPGAEHFGGLLKNTDAYDRLAELLGITHRNPQMTAAAAQAYAANAPEVAEPHWA